MEFLFSAIFVFSPFYMTHSSPHIFYSPSPSLLYPSNLYQQLYTYHFVFFFMAQ